MLPDDNPVKVLDKGTVQLLGRLGDESTICLAARVSTKGSDALAAAIDPEKDKKLIAYLMRNGHGTPFEHVVLQFRVKAPIFVAREWFRHRIGSFNEQSGRYMEYKQEFYVPDHKRVQDPENKQGSIREGYDDAIGAEIIQYFEVATNQAFASYVELLDAGWAKEMARMVLPPTLYTTFWWTVNIRSLLNFLELRNHPSAMFEIRAYAQVIEELFMALMPWTHTTWLDNGRRAP